MFLDEQLLAIGRKAEMTSEGIIDAIRKMINCCFSSMEQTINGRQNEILITRAFQRTNIIWRNVARKLREEGKGIIREDGFRDFVETRNEFKSIRF